MKLSLKLNFLYILLLISNQLFATELKAPLKTSEKKVSTASKNSSKDDLDFIEDEDIEVVAETPEESCELVGKWKCYNFSKLNGISNEMKQRYLKKACDLENHLACEEIGFNCPKGNFKACILDALGFEEKKNYKKAFELYEKSCIGGAEKACSYAILLAEKIKDKKKEFKFNEIMCSQGMISGCKELAMIYYDKGNDEKELFYQKKGCELGDYSMCFSAGLVLGSLGKKEESLPWISTACNNNIVKACDHLKKIGAIDRMFNQNPSTAKKVFNTEENENANRAELLKGLQKAAEGINKALTNSGNSTGNETTPNYNFNAGTSTPYYASCGIKPIPNIGCRVGRCVDGRWEQICDSSPALSCGIKPIPNIGCRIGRCVDGAWEQVCDSNSSLTCGIRPIPKIGCQIGRCVDGRWEQICN